jgi:hypothetical protein
VSAVLQMRTGPTFDRTRSKGGSQILDPLEPMEQALGSTSRELSDTRFHATVFEPGAVSWLMRTLSDPVLTLKR